MLTVLISAFVETVETNNSIEINATHMWASACAVLNDTHET